MVGVGRELIVLLTGLRLGGGSLSLLEEAELTCLSAPTRLSFLQGRAGRVMGQVLNRSPQGIQDPLDLPRKSTGPVFSPAQALGSLPALTERACDKV